MNKPTTEESVKAAASVQPPPPGSLPAGHGRQTANESKGDQAAINLSRRRLVLGCIWGYLGVNFLMFLRYFFPRTLFEPNTLVNIGYPSDFAFGVNQQFLISNRIWVRKDPGTLFVIRAICTHLGCTPDWLPAQHMFHCPCHGSEYDIDGINFAGPAPRPMDRCRVDLQPDGTVLVNTAQLFVDESYAGIDQFNDPHAFLSI